MRITLPKETNSLLKIAVIKQSKNTAITRNTILKQSVIKAVENVVNDRATVKCRFSIVKPNEDGLYICRLQFSRFPIVLAYKANSQTWLKENGDAYADEVVTGWIPIKLDLLSIELR